MSNKRSRGPSPRPPVSTGAQASAYELLDVIGEGAFSVVHRARFPADNSLLAVKRLKKAEAAARILDEVGCLVALRGCENVVTVTDCVRHEGGPVDIVMP